MTGFEWIPYAIAAVGAVYAGQQASAANKYSAKVAEDNAVNAGRQANAAEEQSRRAMRLRLSEQRAAAAQMGFDPNTGSMAALQVQSAGEAELDALTTRYSGQLSSLSLKNEASGLRANASAAKTQGYLNAFGSLSSGYGSYGQALRFGSSSTVGTMAPGAGSNASSSNVGMSY